MRNLIIVIVIVIIALVIWAFARPATDEGDAMENGTNTEEVMDQEGAVGEAMDDADASDEEGAMMEEGEEEEE